MVDDAYLETTQPLSNEQRSVPLVAELSKEMTGAQLILQPRSRDASAFQSVLIVEARNKLEK